MKLDKTIKILTIITLALTLINQAITLTTTITKTTNQQQPIQITKTWEKDLGSYVLSVSWSPDGAYLAVGTGSNKVFVYRRSGELVWETSDLGSDVKTVSWSRDGNYLAAGTESDRLLVFTRTGRVLWQKDLGGDIWSISWSPSGEYLAVGTHSSCRVFVFTRSGELVWEKYLGVRVGGVSWSPTGNYIAVGTAYNNFYLYTNNGDLVYEKDYPGTWSIDSVAWSPNGRYIAITVDEYVKILDVNSNEIASSPNLGDDVNSVSWSPDGEYIAAGTGSNNIYRVYILNSLGEIVWESGNQNGWINSVSWSLDGEYLAVGVGSPANKVIVYKILGYVSLSISVVYSSGWSIYVDGAYVGSDHYSGAITEDVHNITISKNGFGESFLINVADNTSLVLYFGFDPCYGWILYNFSEIIGNNRFIVKVNNLSTVSEIIVDDIHVSTNNSIDNEYVLLFLEAGVVHNISIISSISRYYVYSTSVTGDPGGILDIYPVFKAKSLLVITMTDYGGRSWNLYIDGEYIGKVYAEKVCYLEPGSHTIVISRDKINRSFNIYLEENSSSTLKFYYGFDIERGWHIYDFNEIISYNMFIAEINELDTIGMITVDNVSISSEEYEGLERMLLFLYSNRTYNITLVPIDSKYYPMHSGIHGNTGELISISPTFTRKPRIIIVVNNYDGTYALYINNTLVANNLREQHAYYLDPGVYSVKIVPKNEEYMLAEKTAKLIGTQSLTLYFNIRKKPVLHLYVNTSIFTTYFLYIDGRFMGAYNTNTTYDILVDKVGLVNITIVPGSIKVKSFTDMLNVSSDGNYSIGLRTYKYIGYIKKYLIGYSNDDIFYQWLYDNSLGLIIANYSCSCELVVDGISVSGCGSYVVPAGNHSIILNYPDGSYSGWVYVGAGETVELGVSKLLLRSNVPASVHVDGRVVGDVGPGDVLSLDVYPGRHIVVYTVSTGEYTASIDYTVDIGFNAEHSVEARFSKLVIKGVNGGVWIDGRYVGTYGGNVEVYVAPGRHKVKVSSTNALYSSYEVVVSVTGDKAVIDVYYPYSPLAYGLALLCILAIGSIVYSTKIRPRIVVETIEPREIIEEVTRSLNIVVVNKGFRKAVKRITVKLGGQTIYDETITVPGRKKLKIAIPLKELYEEGVEWRRK